MNVNFEAVRFVIETRSPIVMTEFAPQFDSLVFEALQQCTLLDRNGIIERMKSLIKFHKEFGVFHASAMRFGITAEQGITPRKYVRVDSLRDKLSSQYFGPNGKPKKDGTSRYVAVTTAGGPFSLRLNERLSYESPFVCFDAFCDVSNVTKLLENNFIGIGYDAFRAGQGEIKRITSLPLDVDCSLFCNGEARRNLPSSIKGVSGVLSLSPLVPPYYQEVRTSCFSAPRISTISKDNLTKPI